MRITYPLTYSRRAGEGEIRKIIANSASTCSIKDNTIVACADLASDSRQVRVEIPLNEIVSALRTYSTNNPIGFAAFVAAINAPIFVER